MICVGIDIAKGKSTVCFLKPGGEVLKAPYDIEHTAEEVGKHVGNTRERPHADDRVAGNHALHAARPGFGVRGGEYLYLLENLFLILTKLGLEVAEALFSLKGKFLHLVHGAGHAHIMRVNIKPGKIGDALRAQVTDAAPFAEFPAADTAIQCILHSVTRLYVCPAASGRRFGNVQKKKQNRRKKSISAERHLGKSRAPAPPGGQLRPF